jgi:hypothetical protein
MPTPRWKAFWIVPLVMGLAAAVTHGAAPPPSGRPGHGTLEIAGKGVEKLVLDGPRAGEQQTLDLPGPSVSLPAGQYSVRQVMLQGGFEGSRVDRPGSVPQVYQFKIAPGQSHRINVGAPLTSSVTVKRRGSVLHIDYAIADAGGWRYFPRGSQNTPPQVNFYRGDEKIGSGTFEYG